MTSTCAIAGSLVRRPGVGAGCGDEAGFLSPTPALRIRRGKRSADQNSRQRSDQNLDHLRMPQKCLRACAGDFGHVAIATICRVAKLGRIRGQFFTRFVKRGESRVDQRALRNQHTQIVHLGNRFACARNKCLQCLLGSLLAMVSGSGRKWVRAGKKFARSPKIIMRAPEPGVRFQPEPVRHRGAGKSPARFRASESNPSLVSFAYRTFSPDLSAHSRNIRASSPSVRLAGPLLPNIRGTVAGLVRWSSAGYSGCVGDVA